MIVERIERIVTHLEVDWEAGQETGNQEAHWLLLVTTSPTLLLSNEVVVFLVGENVNGRFW